MTKINCPINDVEPLVPHSGRMVLLDRIIEYGSDFLIAESTITPNHILLRNGKLATFAGIEIMAQGIAAWSGCIATEKGQTVRLGYLLGTRKLHIYSQYIEIGTRLKISIKMSIQDASGFGVFDCQLMDLATNTVLLEGALNVFSPENNQR